MTTLALPRTALHVTAMAVPLAGWTLHTTVLHRRLVQAQRDPLTGTWRREAFTERAQRLPPAHDHPRAAHAAQLDDRSHFRFTPAPCVLCSKPAMLRFHAGEVVHKGCAEIWNLRNPLEVRFVSDDRPRRRKYAGAHA